MEEGHIVRVAMPQADGEHKPRPAVLLKQFPPDGDWLMPGISGSLGRAVPGGVKERVLVSDHSWSRAPMKSLMLPH